MVQVCTQACVVQLAAAADCHHQSGFANACLGGFGTPLLAALAVACRCTPAAVASQVAGTRGSLGEADRGKGTQLDQDQLHNQDRVEEIPGQAFLAQAYQAAVQTCEGQQASNLGQSLPMGDRRRQWSPFRFVAWAVGHPDSRSYQTDYGVGMDVGLRIVP